MQSRGDIIVAMANFYSFSKYMVEDVDKDTPTVIKALLQIVKILNTSEGRKFGEWFANHPEVFHGILMDTQQVINNFTRIASRYEYRQAVLSSNAISVDAYKAALTSSQLYINRIYNATTTMAMDVYNVIPLTLALFQPPSENKKKANGKKDSGPGNQQDRKSDDMDTDPPTKNTKKPDKAKEGKRSKGTPGILRWDGKGNIPFPNVWADKPDGTKQKLCANYTFQDRVCKFPNCTFFHAKTQNDLTPGMLTDLQKWVLNKDKVEFTMETCVDDNGK